MVHNRDLHKTILQTWKLESTQMWERLAQAGITHELACVLQERMWNRQEQLIQAGIPANDARQVAEREHLMLESEKEVVVPEEANDKEHDRITTSRQQTSQSSKNQIFTEEDAEKARQVLRSKLDI